MCRISLCIILCIMYIFICFNILVVWQTTLLVCGVYVSMPQRSSTTLHITFIFYIKKNKGRFSDMIPLSILTWVICEGLRLPRAPNSWYANNNKISKQTKKNNIKTTTKHIWQQTQKRVLRNVLLHTNTTKNNKLKSHNKHRTIRYDTIQYK